MKKNIVIAAFALTSTALIYSCSKENTISGINHSNGTAPVQTASNTRTAGVAQKNSTKADKHWENSIKDCTTPAINCLPEVVVKPSKLADMLLTIDQDPTPKGKSRFFNTSKGIAVAKALGLDADDLANLQSGTYNVIHENSGSTQGLVYFFFGPAETLSMDNAEYIIPVTE